MELDNVLRKVERPIEWWRIGWKVDKVRSRLRRAGSDVDLTIRVLLPGQRHTLPDRPAKEGEAPHLKAMLKGCIAAWLPADKACSSASNREILATTRLRSGIIFRTARAHPPIFRKKTFNKPVATRR